MKTIIFVVINYENTLHIDVLKHKLSKGWDIIIGWSNPAHKATITKTFSSEIAKGTLKIVKMPKVTVTQAWVWEV